MHGRNYKADKYFLFEDSYVETEWKDMISVHYINTSYEVSNTVMRIHIFQKPEIKQDFYLGCFTLRKINEVKIMLSFIYPNWSKVYYNGQMLCVMTYRKKIHIGGQEIIFNTYPLFVQDNITVACAQANVISMTKYLHQKFDYRNARILDLNAAISFGKAKLFPTAGLNPTQIVGIFDYYNIPIGYQIFMLDPKADEELRQRSYEEFRKYIDYTIESGIPIMLGISIQDKSGRVQRHVIQIIGHTKQDRKTYVFYDDSGYFLKEALKTKGFVGCIPWKQIQDYISSEKSFIIYPIHEKVYLLYDGIVETFLHMYNYLADSMPEEFENIDMSKTRFLLVDNRDLKDFFRTSILPDPDITTAVQEEVNNLLMQGMPHYVWCCEIEINMGYFLFVADPTYGKVTTKNIFFNKIPIFTKYQIGLLKYQ